MNTTQTDTTTEALAYHITRNVIGCQVEVVSETRLVARDDEDSPKVVISVSDAEAQSMTLTLCTPNGVILGEAHISGMSERTVSGFVASMLR